MKEFENVFSDLHIVKTERRPLVYLQERLVPPKAARKKLLDLLHSTTSHSAMEWATIREIWWLNGMRNELEQRNRACLSCAVEKRAKNSEKPFLPVDLFE